MNATDTSDWCQIRGEYFPPANEVVWTTDGNEVRIGIWHSTDPSDWKHTAPPSFDPGIWEDENGTPIAVTHWIPREDSLDSPHPFLGA